MIKIKTGNLSDNRMAKTQLVKYKDNDINYDTVSTLLTLVWAALEKYDIGISGIKKIYSIATECLENICKHSDFLNSDKLFIFEMNIDKNTIYISTSNYVNKNKVKAIVERIIFLKKQTPIRLKELYQQEIKKRTFSNKGGAGLGLIIMTRKSEGNIDCSVKQINNTTSVLTLNIRISII